MALFIVHADYSEAENRCKPSTVASDLNADASRDIELSRFFPLRFPVWKRFFAKANKRRQCLHEKRISFVYFSYLSNMVEWIALRLSGFTQPKNPFYCHPTLQIMDFYIHTTTPRNIPNLSTENRARKASTMRKIKPFQCGSG